MSDSTPGKDLVVASNAYSRAGLTERQQYIRMLAAAGNLLPSHLRGAGNVGDPGKAFLLAETGDMLGIHPMAAVTGVHIIEGKPSLSANLMTGLVRKAGHKLRVWVDGDLKAGTLAAHAELIRSDDPDFTFKVTWSLDDAKAAGLYPGKPSSNWQKYTRAMLKSRVTSEIVREGASDVLMGGNIYTPEELGATVDEQGDPIDLPEVRQPGVTPQRADGDVSRETPIVDDAPQDDGTFDWGGELAKAGTKTEVGDLYQRARREGLLTMPIQWGGAKRELGEVIIEVGQAFAAAEEAGTVEATVDEHDEGEPAVLDPDVVDAEVVEEGQ